MRISTKIEHKMFVRNGISGITQLLAHAEMITRVLEIKVNLDTIFPDFQEAFDKADHSVM